MKGNNVYVLKFQYDFGYEDAGFEIVGVYGTLKRAREMMKRLVAKERENWDDEDESVEIAVSPSHALFENTWDFSFSEYTIKRYKIKE